MTSSSTLSDSTSTRATLALISSLADITHLHLVKRSCVPLRLRQGACQTATARRMICADCGRQSAPALRAAANETVAPLARVARHWQLAGPPDKFPSTAPAFRVIIEGAESAWLPVK